MCFFSGWQVQHCILLGGVQSLWDALFHGPLHRPQSHRGCGVHSPQGHSPSGNLEVVSRGSARLARLRAVFKAAGAGCHIQIKHPTALMVTATETENGSPPSSCRLFGTIGLLHLHLCGLAWAGARLQGLCHGPLHRQSVYTPPVHFLIAVDGYPCLHSPLPLITPHFWVNEGVAAQQPSF